MITAAEFFAGIGLMRAGLASAGIKVVWANDLSPLKRRVYEANFGACELRQGDVRQVRGDELPKVDLATASWPCIDVSIAGNRAGLGGEHSSLFFEFARVINEMGERKPAVVLLENVPGLISANGGSDLRLVLAELNALGYLCDPVVVDAAWFVPHSRPRLFVIGTRESAPDPLVPASSLLRPAALCAFMAANADSIQLATRTVIPPQMSYPVLNDIIDEVPDDDLR